MSEFEEMMKRHYRVVLDEDTLMMCIYETQYDELGEPVWCLKRLPGVGWESHLGIEGGEAELERYRRALSLPVLNAKHLIFLDDEAAILQCILDRERKQGKPKRVDEDEDEDEDDE